MRGGALHFAVLLVGWLCGSVVAWDASNATHYPTFPRNVHSNPANATAPPPFQYFHSSLSTLLPILPLLSPPPTHTLAVTFATPAFRQLLYNFICFLRYKAKWGKPIAIPGYPELPYGEVLKLLVVTSDKAFAQELADQNVVVWYLQGTTLGDGSADLTDEELDDELRNDLFLNLRIMDLLLPPKPPQGEERAMLKWGSLHYQSLMLERSLAMATLVGTLADAQKVETEDRKRAEKVWLKRMHAHDWSESRIYPEHFVGVKGVLVVDNDAVWLSSPAAFLATPYRPAGPHPAVVWAGDNAHTLKNAWGSWSVPCACFFYARTSSDLSHTSNHLLPHEADDYLPALDAALIWRTTALCHIAVLLKALKSAREQARSQRLESDQMVDFVKAIAPSFQATALGPAVGLAEKAPWIFERVDHERFKEAVNSGNEDDLLVLLDELGIGEGEDCVALVGKQLNTSPNLLHETTLSRPAFRRPRSPTNRVRTETLPFAHFPPGMSYFGNDQEEGIRPHAEETHKSSIHALFGARATPIDGKDVLRKWALLPSSYFTLPLPVTFIMPHFSREHLQNPYLIPSSARPDELDSLARPVSGLWLSTPLVAGRSFGKSPPTPTAASFPLPPPLSNRMLRLPSLDLTTSSDKSPADITNTTGLQRVGLTLPTHASLDSTSDDSEDEEVEEATTPLGDASVRMGYLQPGHHFGAPAYIDFSDEHLCAETFTQKEAHRLDSFTTSLFPTFGDFLPQHFSSRAGHFNEVNAKVALGLGDGHDRADKLSTTSGLRICLEEAFVPTPVAPKPSRPAPRSTSLADPDFPLFSPFESDLSPAAESFTFHPSPSFHTPSFPPSTPPQRRFPATAAVLHLQAPLTPPRSRPSSCGPPPNLPLPALPLTPPHRRNLTLSSPPHSEGLSQRSCSPKTELSPASAASTYPLSPEDTGLVARLHEGRIPTLEQLAPPEAASACASGAMPIVNTGNVGPMVVQTGDWKCGSCSFVNWRRRKICMRCFPFAHDIGSKITIASHRAANYMFNSSPPSSIHSGPPTSARMTCSTSMPAMHYPRPFEYVEPLVAGSMHRSYSYPTPIRVASMAMHQPPQASDLCYVGFGTQHSRYPFSSTTRNAAPVDYSVRKHPSYLYGRQPAISTGSTSPSAFNSAAVPRRETAFFGY